MKSGKKCVKIWTGNLLQQFNYHYSQVKHAYNKFFIAEFII
jgi:hypothetical protein